MPSRSKLEAATAPLTIPPGMLRLRAMCRAKIGAYNGKHRFYFIDELAWAVAQCAGAIHFHPASLRPRTVGLAVVAAHATA